MTGADEDGAKAGVSGGLEIGSGVADEPRRCEIDVQIPRCLLNHSGLWLAAIAFDVQIGAFTAKAFLRMMRAVVNAVEERMVAAEQRFEFVVDLLNIGFAA